MNYTMGRYIDEATDEQRDRLVTAEDFTNGAWVDGRGCGCLVGTAEAFGAPEARGSNPFKRRAHEGLQNRFRSRPDYYEHYWQNHVAAYRYPRAVARFGKARVVRAIKLRAAATTSRLEEAQPSEATP